MILTVLITIISLTIIVTLAAVGIAVFLGHKELDEPVENCGARDENLQYCSKEAAGWRVHVGESGYEEFRLHLCSDCLNLCSIDPTRIVILKARNEAVADYRYELEEKKRKAQLQRFKQARKAEEKKAKDILQRE